MLPNINPIWTYFFLICGHCSWAKKKKKLFFLFYMHLPSRAVGRPEESWTKWWGWLGQGVFRASLPHNRPHQDTLAHWRGHLQSLKEIMPLISTATLHIWRHVQQLTDGPVLYNQGFTSKFIWPKIRHLPHGLRWETVRLVPPAAGGEALSGLKARVTTLLIRDIASDESRS